MPIPITVPRLGWSMDEGTLGEWLKRSGEAVRPGEALFVLEADKAAQEIEAIDGGILHLPPDAPRSGSVVAVGQCLGFLLAEGEVPPTSIGPPTPSATTTTLTAPGSARPSSAPPRVAGPAARRLARQMNVSLDEVATPDPTGRVHSSDVRHAATSTVNPSQVAVRPSTKNSAANCGRIAISPRARSAGSPAPA